MLSSIFILTGFEKESTMQLFVFYFQAVYDLLNVSIRFHIFEFFWSLSKPLEGSIMAISAPIMINKEN